MSAIALRAALLTLAALSLGLSFAHALEAPPRLRNWPPDLWRETTVFHGQYALFGALGGPIEIATVILALIAAAVAIRGGEGRVEAVVGAMLFVAALVVWLAVVNRANGVMATWRPGPLPVDFAAIQRRWETGHIVMAGLKLLGFLSLALWAIRPARGRAG